MNRDVTQQFGNVMVRTFREIHGREIHGREIHGREIYGDDFAKDVGSTTKLAVAVETPDAESKSKVQTDADDGSLRDNITDNL